MDGWRCYSHYSPHIWANSNLSGLRIFVVYPNCISNSFSLFTTPTGCLRSSSQQVSIMSPSRVTNLDKLDYEPPGSKKRWVKTWGSHQEKGELVCMQHGGVDGEITLQEYNPRTSKHGGLNYRMSFSQPKWDMDGYGACIQQTSCFFPLINI